MAYALSLTKDHRLSLLELTNYDNAATIGTALDQSNTTVGAPGVTADAGIAATHPYTANLALKTYPADNVDVYYNKVVLGDAFTVQASDFEGWYNPATFNDEGSTQAVQLANAIKAAALRGDVDLDQLTAGESLTITHVKDTVTNRWYASVSGGSHVFKTELVDGISLSRFQLPQHFSELVTVTELNGFIYSPIAAAAVVE